MKLAASIFSFTARTPATATEWAVRMHSAEATEADRRAFKTWLAADPSHRAAYERSEQLWTLTRRARIDHDMLRDLIAEADEQAADASVDRRQIRWAMPAIAASLVTVALVAGLLAYRIASDTISVATRPGEQRTMHLSDGSKIELNTNTRVSYKLTSEERRVTLDQGEAFFDVAKDPHRPFIVKVDRSEVRVTGTKFTVRRNNGRLDVIVMEGKVEVVPDAPLVADAQRVQLTPGNRVQLELANHTIQVASVDVSRAMAWRTGEIEFRGESLETVIAELNRYTGKPMRIEDDALRQVRVSGLFRVADTQSVRFLLQESLGVELHERDREIGITAGHR